MACDPPDLRGTPQADAIISSSKLLGSGPQTFEVLFPFNLFMYCLSYNFTLYSFTTLSEKHISCHSTLHITYLCHISVITIGNASRSQVFNAHYILVGSHALAKNVLNSTGIIFNTYVTCCMHNYVCVYSVTDPSIAVATSFELETG